MLSIWWVELGPTAEYLSLFTPAAALGVTSVACLGQLTGQLGSRVLNKETGPEPGYLESRGGFIPRVTQL